MKKNFNLKLLLIAIFVLSVCFTLPVGRISLSSTAFQLKPDQLTKKEGKWHYFKKGTKISVNELISKNFTIFDLPEGISSKIEKEDIDELGIKHYLLKLEMHGIPIEDGVYTVHYSKEGDLMHVVGKYDKNAIPKEKVLPSISRSEAFQKAKDAFISEQKVVNQDAQKPIADELTNLFNEGKIDPQLVYFRKEKNDNLKLSYKVDITAESVPRLITFYIDAKTGSILKTVDHRAQAVADIQTVYNGWQTAGVEWRGWPYSYYYLRMEGYSTPIETRNSSTHDGCIPWGFGNLDLVYKGTTNWPIDFKENAASSHWAVKEAYTVFRNTYGRTYGTFSTSGGEIRMENNYRTSGPFYDHGGSYDYIHVGYTMGTTNGFEGSLDIIGHEFTHGVMYRAREVDGYAYDYTETGELMESFADIFGVMIEYYTTGSTDYIVGTNTLDDYKRSLQNPRGYPGIEITAMTWDGSCKYSVTGSTFHTVPLYWHEPTYWLYTGERGVPAHINCSVQNYWFYLLANGGSQLGVSVTGIGLSSASRIAYRNMVYYLSLGSDFDDMRQASIANAAVLYGECSNEYVQVQNAWAAVNVGAAGTPCINTEIVGPESLMCGEGGYYYANTHGGSGSYTYSWYVDYTYYSSASSISLGFYPQYGGEYHYIYLEVTDGTLSDSDDHGIYVYQCGQGGLQNNETLRFKLYPNPATTSTKVEIEDDITQYPAQYAIQIFDRNGRMVYSDKSYSTEFMINTSFFQKGIYSAIIKCGKKTGSTNLIIE